MSRGTLDPANATARKFRALTVYAAIALSIVSFTAGALDFVPFGASIASAKDRGRDHDGGWKDRGDMDRENREMRRQAERDAREQQKEYERQARDQQRNQEREDRRQNQNDRHHGWDSNVDRDDEGDNDGQNDRGSGSNGGSGGGPHTGSNGSNSGSNDRPESGETNSGNNSGHSAGGQGKNASDDGGRRGGRSDDSAEGDRGDDSAPSEDGRPPSTVVQWLKQLNKPAKDLDKTKPVARRAGPQKPLPKVSNALPKMPAFRSPEVLAVNATGATVARAEALGFKTNGATSFTQLDFGVTRLIVPAGMTALDAQALLMTELPEARVSVNQTYRIIRPAAGSIAEAKQVPAKKAPAGGAVPCGLDRCFGRDIVGWRAELRSCAAGVKIGIIDTAVDTSHPAFVRKKIEVQHLGVSGSPGPNFHGTGVTALLAGDASSGTPGLVPEANFYVADIFHAGSDSLPASDTFSMLRAFDWLEAKDVKIINISLSGPADPLIAKAIEKLSAKGIMIVAAAGNGGPAAPPSYPAAYDKVIAVTAVGQNLKSYRYANRGAYIDISAPGVAIWTAIPGSKEGYHSGTSFATPFVTAALAAIYPRLPASSPADVLKMLSYRDLGEPGQDKIYGQGLLIAPVSCRDGAIATAPKRQLDQLSKANHLKPPEPAAGQAEVLPWLVQSGKN